MKKIAFAIASLLLVIVLLNHAAAEIPVSIAVAIRSSFDVLYPNISPSDKAQIELVDLTLYPFGHNSTPTCTTCRAT